MRVRAELLRWGTVNITPLGADELPEVSALLVANGLPVADLSPAIHFLGVRDDRGLEGIVGLERHGTDGLLRSLAVRPDRRGSGLGSALVLEVERLARSEGLASLYLLTTTAEPFFAHRGYAPIPRDAVAPAIRASSEFASVCPTSASVMHKAVDRGTE
ncbi:MAG: GNAT family N-acetyltransferase [Gemmatimonadetes bacterium]|nr:GNAT family N-acetyltransferase [Gemmatimonadota bacterium]MBK7350362.1 GNAT family N-acetyltransferase [Gemmatimonadota bacterium]MBK7785505.1 GNAT family N-acetyltransferase [Gemmatimonadota bacterium]MBP9201339.1 GNAT family N-acetyltransferase [Gemmatimonadales bacterium]